MADNGKIVYMSADFGHNKSKGPFKKYVTGLGGRGSSKIVTNSDKGEGVKPNSDDIAYEKIL